MKYTLNPVKLLNIVILVETLSLTFSPQANSYFNSMLTFSCGSNYVTTVTLGVSYVQKAMVGCKYRGDYHCDSIFQAK